MTMTMTAEHHWSGSFWKRYWYLDRTGISQLISLDFERSIKRHNFETVKLFWAFWFEPKLAHLRHLNDVPNTPSVWKMNYRTGSTDTYNDHTSKSARVWRSASVYCLIVHALWGRHSVVCVPRFGDQLIGDRCPDGFWGLLLLESPFKHPSQLLHVKGTHGRARNAAGDTRTNSHNQSQGLLQY